MEIKNKKSFNNLIKSLTLEVLKDEELDEMTVTSDIDGYNTPFFLTGQSKKGKAKKKKISTNSTGYKMLEGIDSVAYVTPTAFSEVKLNIPIPLAEAKGAPPVVIAVALAGKVTAATATTGAYLPISYKVGSLQVLLAGLTEP